MAKITNQEIRNTIALNQVKLEKIIELAESMKATSPREVMLLDAVKQLADGFKEVLDNLGERIK